MSDKVKKLQELIDKKNPFNKLVDSFNVMKGDQGIQGEPGYTPIIYKDYFTSKQIDDIASFIEKSVQSKIRIPKDGEQGKDAINPTKGLDYWTPKDREQIIKEVLKDIKVPKDGVSPKMEDIASLVVKELKKKPIASDIVTESKLIDFLRKGGFRGGGISDSPIDGKQYARKDGQWVEITGGTSAVTKIIAGTNVTISPVSGLGDVTINASGGSYTLPTASASVLGGVKVGTRLSIDGNGVLSADAQSGSGDVTGPVSAVDSNFASFDTTTGKLIKDSGKKASDFLTSLTGAVLTDQTVAQTIGTTGARLNKLWADNIQVTNAPIIDSLTASGIVFTGTSKQLTSTGIGTSSQFIKGDGSLDSNTYLTTGTASSTYIPYTGGTTNVNLGLHNLTVDTNSLFVDSVNHRVGIGTTTPDGLLTIKSNSAFLLKSDTAGYGGGLRYDTASGENLIVSTTNINTKIMFATGFDNTINQGINNTLPSNPELTISNGNVGIGTTGPKSYANMVGLTIGDNSASKIGFLKFKSDYNAGEGAEIYQTSAGKLYFNLTNSAVGMVIDNLGNVGIGTTAPANLLNLSSSGAAGNSTSIRLDNTFSTVNNRNWEIGTNTNAYGDFSINQSSTQGGDPNLGTPRFYIDPTGNVGIGTTTPTSQLTQKSTTALESATLGTELLSTANWTTTGWTGTDPSIGFTHTIGNTTALTNTLAAVTNNLYQIAFTITGRTAGTITISFGGNTSVAYLSTSAWGTKATSTGSLSITPTTDFDGVVTISIKQITSSYLPLYAIQDNTGTSTFEIRSSLSSLANTFVGKSAGAYNTTGNLNTAFGNTSLFTNTSGYQNVSIGGQSMFLNTTGYQNTAVGVYALYTNISGVGNTSIGFQSLQGNFSSSNTAIGFQSLMNSVSGGTNTAVGYGSLLGNTTGSNNSVIGLYAGRFIADGTTARTTGNNGLYLGSSTKASAIGTDNEIVIGYNAIGNGSNKTVIGNSSVTDTYFGSSTGASKLWGANLNLTGLTASQLTATDASKNLVSLDVATYPSLTELSYVKGVTSAIQTQIGTLATKTGSNWTFASQAIGDIAYATSTTAYGNLAAPVAGKILTSGGVGVAPLYSVPTFPTSASATTRKIIVSDGTNWTASTETYAVPGTSGNVLTSDGTNWISSAPTGGGTSLWTAITATRVGNTSCTVVGDQTAIFKKGMIIRWQESAVDKVAYVSIPSTFSTNTTITFIGSTMSSIDANSFKYSTILSVFKKSFAIAGNIGATATNVANAFYADKPYIVIGAELSVGTAGTTNSTTIDINKGGTTMFTTKPTLATTVAFATTPFTADTATSLALGDKVTIDIDAIQTTNAQDLYADLILLETRFLTLS